MVYQEHKTFHGREPGYMYREHGDESARGHLDSETIEPYYGVRHGETYGSHKAGDKYEMEHGTDHFVKKDFERFIEPLYDYHEKQPDEHSMHFEPPQYHNREVTYEVDEQGHVHLYEETP